MNLSLLRTGIGILSLLVLCCGSPVLAQVPSVSLDGDSSNPHADLIPQHLLGLIHAPEIHQELKLTPSQVQRLEALFAEIDGPWFQARILPPEKQRPVITQIEGRLLKWFEQFADAQQRARLRQLEYRAQGIRMLLRPDLSQKLGLTSTQLDELAKRAQTSAEATKTLFQATKSGKQTEEQKTAVVDATKAEQSGPQEIMKPEQMQKLNQILGEPFDTTQLKRIYPMAPEFRAVKNWINSSPLQLKQMRGKVVLVHFYAFQCHNCHANFDHYRKWHEEMKDKGVVVIGIQSPETNRERDPSAVRAAAVEKNLEFPILVDLEMENWNAWANTMWPTVYVIDKNGYLRHWWQGELNWQGATGDETIENIVSQLLEETS